MRFCASKTGLSTIGSFSADCSKAVRLLQFFFVRRFFHMWLLFCDCLYLTQTVLCVCVRGYTVFMLSVRIFIHPLHCGLALLIDK